MIFPQLAAYPNSDLHEKSKMKWAQFRHNISLSSYVREFIY